MNKHASLWCTVALALTLGSSDSSGQNVATEDVESTTSEQILQQTSSTDIRARSSHPLLGDLLIPWQKPTEPLKHWTVVPSYSWSFFNKGRESWYEEDLQVMYSVNRTFLIGVEVDLLQRPPAGNDEIYSVFASWYPWKFLEVHGKISICPDPDFSPNQNYQGGFEWQVMPRVALLLDYQQLNFAPIGPVGPGSIEQIKPGVSFWFNDDTFLTLRYARGYAFNDFGYNYYSAALNIGGLPHGGRLTMGFAYGTDPDLDFGTGDTSLSPAYTYSLFYRHPINKDLSVYAGVQYVYRLKQDSNEELYQQLTPSIGLLWKF